MASSFFPTTTSHGRKHFQSIARSLHASGIPVKVLLLPDLPPKGDVSDWIAAGGTRMDLLRLRSETPGWIPSAMKPIEGFGFHLRPRRLLAEPEKELVARDGMLPAAGLSVQLRSRRPGRALLRGSSRSQ